MSNHGIRNNDDLKLWFRIKSIEKKTNKLGSMHSRGFDWIEWESLEEDLANNISQLSIHKNIVKEVLSRYD
tara:strand:- start:110 stop:322 length:213 start_codon:yes stop_codon:yes gene_type:complete